MPAISIRAHFDGTNILLDEPFELQRDAQLLVTVLSTAKEDTSLRGWSELSANGLANAYGDNEPEYGTSDIVP
jgi:hypothetical protein